MPSFVKSRLNDFRLLRVLAIDGLNPVSEGEETLGDSANVVLRHFALPKTIGNQIHLRDLSLRETTFIMFPSSIKSLIHLYTLDL